jgi:hypothetical protein
MLAISPNFTPAKLESGALADKIDVYEDQVLGWIINPAKLMFDYEHSGFAILALALTYFEPLGQSLSGGIKNSYECFSCGFFAVFSMPARPDIEVARVLYDQLRCGMFHRGFAKGMVRITRDQEAPLVVHGDSGVVHTVIVNPWVVLLNVESHVREHCASLRVESCPDRQNFESWFDRRAA